jgi:hypothetical protein
MTLWKVETCSHMWLSNIVVIDWQFVFFILLKKLSIRSFEWEFIVRFKYIFNHGATALGLIIVDDLCSFQTHHTQTHPTLRRTPMACDQPDAETTQNIHNRQTSMPPEGFEPTVPASVRQQTHANGIGKIQNYYTFIENQQMHQNYHFIVMLSQTLLHVSAYQRQGRIKLFGAPRQWKNFRPLFQAVFLSCRGGVLPPG